MSARTQVILWSGAFVAIAAVNVWRMPPSRFPLAMVLLFSFACGASFGAEWIRHFHVKYAPKPKADAWDEGYEAGHQDARAVPKTYPDDTPNPYRESEGQ